VATHASSLRDARALLRCPDCRRSLELQGSDGAGTARLMCDGCAREYPIGGGTPVLLRRDAPASPLGGEAELRRRTAESFAYEWEHFGELRPEWELNFRQYIRPHEPEWFRDRVIAALLPGRHRPRVIVDTFHGHVLTGYLSPLLSAAFTAVERLLALSTRPA
jgi:uncharacterized protein YbaR (Trm112 family)